MGQPTKPVGRPRRSDRSRVAIATGARELHAQLARFAEAGDVAAMDAAVSAWFAGLVARANHEGPEGNAFMRYLTVVLMVLTDNTPDLTPQDAVVLQLLPRIFSSRRDARAYARHLAAMLDHRRAVGLAIHPFHLEASQVATQRAKGKGRGDDPDIYFQDAYDLALLRAYEGGLTAQELTEPDDRARAFAAHLPPWAELPRYQDPHTVYKRIRIARTKRDITRLAFRELLTLAEYLPHLSPLPPGFGFA